MKAIFRTIEGGLFERVISHPPASRVRFPYHLPYYRYGEKVYNFVGVADSDRLQEEFAVYVEQVVP
jgi:hypothetical protein